MSTFKAPSRRRSEVNDEEHKRGVNTLCKKRKAIFNKAYEISTRCNQKVYMVIYDERLNRVSQYLSDESFDINKCHELLVTQKNYSGRA